MTQNESSEPPEEKAHFTGEEGGGERTTPRKDLGAAVVIGILAITAMAFSLRLEVPTSIYTAPGLLPFLTGLSLLAMAIGLGVGAIRDGGSKDYFAAARAGAQNYLSQQEARRTLLLIAVLVFYIFLAGQISFNLRLPTPFFVFQFSSWEAISMPILAAILWFFWRAPIWKCGLFSILMIFFLAGIFRYAFHILLPAVG
ncbi:MAG: hypothetical protein HKN28_03460 [Alphaproteobacteria bacterium]|nr:hypothetical protein [Alphaproteobacteria bacterium]